MLAGRSAGALRCTALGLGLVLLAGLVVAVPRAAAAPVALPDVGVTVVAEVPDTT